MRLASDPHPFGIGDVAKPAFSYCIPAASIGWADFHSSLQNGEVYPNAAASKVCQAECRHSPFA